MRFLLLFSTFGSMVYVGLMFMVQLEASLDLHKSDVFFTIYSAFFLAYSLSSNFPFDRQMARIISAYFFR